MFLRAASIILALNNLALHIYAVGASHSSWLYSLASGRCPPLCPRTRLGPQSGAKGPHQLSARLFHINILRRDSVDGRVLKHLVTLTNTTVEACLDACAVDDYALGGLEFGHECCEPTFGWPILFSEIRHQTVETRSSTIISRCRPAPCPAPGMLPNFAVGQSLSASTRMRICRSPSGTARCLRIMGSGPFGHVSSASFIIPVTVQSNLESQRERRPPVPRTQSSDPHRRNDGREMRRWLCGGFLYHSRTGARTGMGVFILTILSLKFALP